MANLDDRLKDLDLEFLHGVAVNLTDDMVAQVKQSFADAGYIQIPTAEKDKAGFIHINPEGIYMTGTYWYERFEKELYKPPKQELPRHDDDDGESHDRFFRTGGENFMYNQAVEAAKRAAGISND